jgi:hypothetical protein
MVRGNYGNQKLLQDGQDELAFGLIQMPLFRGVITIKGKFLLYGRGKVFILQRRKDIR